MPSNEAERLEQTITGMPAAQALRLLAEVLQPGSSPARVRAVTGLMEKVAGTLDGQQTVIRDGLPVDSEPDTVVTIDEYAVRSTHPDGTTIFVTYGDRLYAAVRDATRLPAGELLQRSIVVGTWEPSPHLPADGAPWWYHLPASPTKP